MCDPIRISASNRRRFLTTSLGFAAGVAHGCSSPRDIDRSESTRPPGGEAKMKLSLSVRVAEAFGSKEKSSMTLDELIRMAVNHGYEALCMRASQAGVQTPAETVREMSHKIREAGLVVSMVTGDFGVPRNDEHGPDGLRNIAPYLDLAQAFGTDLIRICMKKDEDIPWAQKACDEARERNIRLAHQAHCASLFETVDGSLRVLEEVGRPNFGIIYEPANWMLTGQDYGRATIRKIAPYLFNVYVQNCRLDSGGTASVNTWTKGNVALEHMGLWDEGGVDFGEVLAELHEVGYQGFVTVHQAFADVMPVVEAVRKSADYLKPRIGPQAG